MPRKHLFAVVVLLGAAAVAGLLAVTRTIDLGAAAATPVSNTQIAAKTRSLDRLEASLQRALADQPEPPAGAASASQRTIYVRPGADSAPIAEHEDEGHEYDDEHEYDDGREEDD